MLTSSPLPPRGVFVPTGMLFHSQLPASVLVTWIQLRALAWQGWSTPAMTLPEFASLLGIHPSRLARHLDHLQGLSSLSLHTNAGGKTIISFPEQPAASVQSRTVAASPPPSPVANPREIGSSEPSSYFPSQIMGYITYPDDLESTVTPVADRSPVDPARHRVSLIQVHTPCIQEHV